MIFGTSGSGRVRENHAVCKRGVGLFVPGVWRYRSVVEFGRVCGDGVVEYAALIERWRLIGRGGTEVRCTGGAELLRKKRAGCW